MEVVDVYGQPRCRRSVPSRTGSAARSIKLCKTLNLAIEPLVEPLGHLEQPSIGDQSHDILRSAQDRGTVSAVCQMRFQSFAQFGRDIPIDIIRDFPPYFAATDFNCTHRALLWSPRSNFPIRLTPDPATVESRRQAVSQQQPRSMKSSFHSSFRNTQNHHRLFHGQESYIPED